MAAVLEVVTILERLPITKEALEVKLRVCIHYDSFIALMLLLWLNVFPWVVKLSMNNLDL